MLFDKVTLKNINFTESQEHGLIYLKATGAEFSWYDTIDLVI